MADENEKRPLLNGGGNEGPSAPPPPPINEQPPPYMEQPSYPQPYGAGGMPYPPSSGPINYPPPTTNPYGTPPPPPGSQAPPAYSAALGQSQFVQCRVCQHVINVPQGTNSRVVKCGSCNEATPITAPPPGKKYVRCPCNCLLTCSVTATRVVCPRANCKRTIGVGSINVRQTVTLDRMRVTCGGCNRTILWPGNAAVARCPHCRRRSYINHSWMKGRAIFCFLLGICFLIAGCIVTGVTAAVAASIGGIYVVSVGFFVSGLALIIRGVFYCAMTHSMREN